MIPCIGGPLHFKWVETKAPEFFARDKLAVSCYSRFPWYTPGLTCYKKTLLQLWPNSELSCTVFIYAANTLQPGELQTYAELFFMRPTRAVPLEVGTVTLPKGTP